MSLKTRNIGTIPFEVPFYDELSVIPRLLDQLRMSESVIVQTEDLLKKSTGISIAAKINGIGFRRKLIARLYHLSQAMDIQSWNHVTLNAGGLNVFSSNGCMVMITLLLIVILHIRTYVALMVI